MRKLITTLLLIFSVTSLLCCIPKQSMDLNKIIAPDPINISIAGTWKIISKTKSNEGSEYYDVIRNINSDTIYISKDLISFGDMKIKNPQFKLKRVKKDIDFNKNIKDNIFKEIKSDLEYIDIISIYDNNKTYFNFIKNDSGNSYVYTTNTILEVEKINEEINNKLEEKNENEIVENGQDMYRLDSEYYKMDVGVLLGIKRPSRIDSNEKFISSRYRTLWISLVDGKIKPIEELDNTLLVPRLNGFSKIDINSSNTVGERKEILTVTNNKKEENETKSFLQEDNVYNDITFVGNDYIGLQYYKGKNFQNKYTKYKIISIDALNVDNSIDLISLYGEKGKEAYENAKEQVIQKSKNNYLKNIKSLESDYRNITLVRKEGQWAIEGRINLKKSTGYVKFYPDVSPVRALLNYDGSIISWNKMKEFKSAIRDFICAPNGRIIITLEYDKLKVYEYDIEGNKIGKELSSIGIDENDDIIMTEWATGYFVSRWTNAVKEYKKENIKK